jgi:hypothetical protein
MKISIRFLGVTLSSSSNEIFPTIVERIKTHIFMFDKISFSKVVPFMR